MAKIVKIDQKENGRFSFNGKALTLNEDLFRVSKARTFLVRNSMGVEATIEARAQEGSLLIPVHTNAYFHSDFNCDTQHVRDGVFYSVYAIEFYQRV